MTACGYFTIDAKRRDGKIRPCPTVRRKAESDGHKIGGKMTACGYFTICLAAPQYDMVQVPRVQYDEKKNEKVGGNSLFYAGIHAKR